MTSKLIVSGLVFAGAMGFSPVGQAQVFISEIMYHPIEEPAFNADGTPVMDLYEEVHEFIELHNPGTIPVSLAGWKLSGGIEFVFPPFSIIQPGQYRVVAKDKARLAAVAAYQLRESDQHGPYAGQLSNQGETIRLLNAENQTVDSVSYSTHFPWPITADALGADEEWTGLKPFDYQYRGRSLERVSFTAPSNDPANWVASPLPGNPSPGLPNAAGPYLKPVVIDLHVAQAADGQRLIRRGQPVRIDCVFSSTGSLANVRLEYFVDHIELTNEAPAFVLMWPVGQPNSAWFTTDLPGLPDRSLVRYRIRADRGDGDEVVSPRADDPLKWQAYFVTPPRSSTNPVYDVFISAKSLRTLQTNITQNPRRITRPDPPGHPRKSWNATEPAVFVHDGVVYDIQMRHHGSRYRRDVNRRSYKFQFPRYAQFNNQTAFFVTDKDYQTEAGHALFRAAGIPTSRTRWVDLYLNNNARLLRLEQEENDDRMLERVQQEQERLHPGTIGLDVGEVYKCVGTAEGPYGDGNGRQLAARLPWWTALQRYEWTFALQDHGWRGHTQFKDMIDKMWAARGLGSVVNTNALRTYFEQRWDVDRELTYLSTINWMVPWDDVFHNYFLWQQRNGKWSQLPWDFDNVMNGQSASTSIFTAAPNAGPNYFKDSFLKAFRDEFRQRAWFLNNTVLHPDHIAALRLHTAIRSWSSNRFRSVNTQLGLGVFERPLKPVNLAPAPGASVSPFVGLESSAYKYSTNPVPGHLSTTWTVRSAKGSYYDPVFRVVTTHALTSVRVPPELLQLGETYFWKCAHTDAIGHPSLDSSETSFTVRVAPRLSTDLVLNEIMADNQSALANDGKFPDWIELYNPADTPRSLSGMSLTDDLLAPTKFLFPTNLVIPARSFLVVWCDNATNAPGLHTGFALEANGETVALYAASPGGFELKDAVSFGLQIMDLSVGRVSGGADFWILNMPTPGAANQTRQLGSPNRLRFNEWLANPNGGDDWIELFNPEEFPVALDGCYLTDALSDPTKSPLRPLSYIPARGFLKIVADGQTGKGGHHADFRLSSHGGALGLYAGDQTAIHTVMYGAQTTGISQGSLIDGSPALVHFSNPTPGKSNAADTDGDGLPDAWELVSGLDPNSPTDSNQDLDGDGFSNLQEYQSATNPREATSHLRLETVGFSGNAMGAATIRFLAAPGVTYTLQFRDTAWPGSWTKLADVPPQIAARSVEVIDPDSAGQRARYYRLVTPAQ
ncbi:MAG: lamin tail domain-containing protein [Verrucomicrobia bacterium]|nr:lamin tail domain-containing protein [Verrucomicrobiota bacterium]